MNEITEFVAEPLSESPAELERILLFDDAFNLCPNPDGGSGGAVMRFPGLSRLRSFCLSVGLATAGF